MTKYKYSLKLNYLDIKEIMGCLEYGFQIKGFEFLPYKDPISPKGVDYKWYFVDGIDEIIDLSEEASMMYEEIQDKIAELMKEVENKLEEKLGEELEVEIDSEERLHEWDYSIKYEENRLDVKEE